jgi:hypothetical protein
LDFQLCIEKQNPKISSGGRAGTMEGIESLIHHQWPNSSARQRSAFAKKVLGQSDLFTERPDPSAAGKPQKTKSKEAAVRDSLLP